MRQRVYVGVVLFGLGLLGAFLSAQAQEKPWPSPVPPAPDTSAQTTPWVSKGPVSTRIISETIIPVQAVLPDAGTLPSSPAVSSAPAPGMFPANVVPIQALSAEAQTQTAENAPPPMFPEPKTQPMPAPPRVAPPGDTRGPMLSPADETKHQRVPGATSPVAPQAFDPGPMAIPKLIEQPPLPMTQPAPAATQPYTPPVPEYRVPVAVPIRRTQDRAPAADEIVSQRMTVPEPAPEATLPAPLLTVEKRGPAELQLGEPVRFEINVRNIGSVQATQVRIEDTLPENVRFLSGSPRPVLEAGRVVWNVPQVAPGQEQKVYLEVQPMAAGDLATQTSVSHTVESRMQVRGPSLSLDVKSPGRGAVGQPVVFEVQLANNSNQALSQLVLNAQMSGGLIHQTGRNIESDPFDLPPLGTKSVTLAATALQPGKQSIDVSILAQGRQGAVAHGEVFVGERSLVVHVPATSRLVLGRSSELPIEIANFDARPARNVVVTSKLSRGLEFEGASDRGTHRSGTVQWTIDYLAPGQSRVLIVRVKARAPAEMGHIVSVRAADGLKAQAEGRVLVDGTSQLSLTTGVRDNPLELNKETVFEIRLTNEGNSPESGVQLQALLPEGMVPRFIEGAGYHLRGNLIVFDPIRRVEPGKQITVRIGALATTPGECRLRVQLASSQLRTPLVREARTWVYADR